MICEASGGYERTLLAVARRAGHQTALVSSEQVGDLTKGETLDTAKTDRKDARVIHLAAAMGKTQRHRDLPEPYVLLRHLTAFHDDEVRTTSAIRTRLQATLRDLFPDYDRPVAFTFSKTGRVLLREGLLCPHRLARLGGPSGYVQNVIVAIGLAPEGPCVDRRLFRWGRSGSSGRLCPSPGLQSATPYIKFEP